MVAKGINEMNALEEEKIPGVFCRLKLPDVKLMISGLKYKIMK